jgi:hypothetical protein
VLLDDHHRQFEPNGLLMHPREIDYKNGYFFSRLFHPFGVAEGIHFQSTPTGAAAIKSYVLFLGQSMLLFEGRNCSNTIERN